MANYTPTFTKPYPSGWVDKPSKTTPATAAIMNSYDTAIAALEAYLRDNAIDTVSVSVEQFPSDGRQWIGTITVGSDQYRIYMPSLKYENSVPDGVKIGAITLGDQSFDVYAPTSSTGGSTVSVVPKTLTGTNIAEITVDGTTYQLYAPTSGGGSGSTVTAEATLTEGTQIGKITIDGVETILYAPNGGGGSITVDSALSATSENPVQNKVLTAELNKKIETLDDESQAPDAVNFDLDSELSLTSVKGVQNKAIAEEFQKYANGTKVVAKATEADTATTASNAEKVNGHTVGADVPSNAVFTDTVYDDSDVKASIQNIVNGTTQVGSATKATQDAQGNVINETYAKKTEIPQGTVVDDALSSTSVNPVQNKVVKAEFDHVNSNLSELKYGEVAGGKNLLQNGDDLLKASETVKNKDGSYTCTLSRLQQTSKINPFFKLDYKNNTQYTVSMNVSNTTADTIYLLWRYDDGTTSEASRFNINDNLIRIAKTSQVGKTCIGLEISYGTSLGRTTISDIQIEEGTQATDYEPYIPSVKMLAEEIGKQKNDLSNLKNGTTSVAKAVADEDGNNIKSTYVKKTEAFETVTEDVNVVLNSDLFDSVYNSNITCIRIGKLCVLSFTIRVKNTISSTIDNIVLMTIVGTKYRPKNLGVNRGIQTFQGFAVGNYDENGTQSQSLNNTVRIITSSANNYTEIITRDKDRINWSGYVQGQIMWVTD